MIRPLLLVVVLSLCSCGSHVEYSPSLTVAIREPDGKVLVKTSLSPLLLGVNSIDDAQITELCVTATWSERAASDAGADGGAADAGAVDAGSPSASDGGVTLQPSMPVGATVATASQCKPGNSAGFELRASQAIAENQGIIVTLVPSESDASRAKHTGSAAPVIFRDVQFTSP